MSPISQLPPFILRTAPRLFLGLSLCLGTLHSLAGFIAISAEAVGSAVGVLSLGLAYHLFFIRYRGRAFTGTMYINFTLLLLCEIVADFFPVRVEAIGLIAGLTQGITLWLSHRHTT